MMLIAESVNSPLPLRGHGNPARHTDDDAALHLVLTQEHHQPDTPGCSKVQAPGEALPDTDESPTSSFPFLALPYELRLEIYELLLCSADPIVVSPRRRQLCVSVQLQTSWNTYLRAPRPKPVRKLVYSGHRKPWVEVLQTCKQVNHEATPILYAKNHFLVGHLIVLNPWQDHLTAGYYPKLFFLWYLRQSTIAMISSITFRKACLCSEWVLLDDKEWSTNGDYLRRHCFPTATSPERLLPSPKPAKDTFVAINKMILASHLPGLLRCRGCQQRYPSLYP